MEFKTYHLSVSTLRSTKWLYCNSAGIASIISESRKKWKKRKSFI